MHFIVMMKMRDPSDPAIQARRAATRDEHIRNATRLQNEGHLLLGGAIFDDNGQLAGSAAIAEFDQRADLEHWLETDPWAVANVWQIIEITEFRIAPHYLKHTNLHD
jgi:uncharacterized protein YciI